MPAISNKLCKYEKNCKLEFALCNDHYQFKDIWPEITLQCFEKCKNLLFLNWNTIE